MTEDTGFDHDLVRWVQSLHREFDTLREVLLVRGVATSSKRIAWAPLAYRLRDLPAIEASPGVSLSSDCFVVRVASALLLESSIQGLSLSSLQKLSRLARDAQLVRTFLGAEAYAALTDLVCKVAAQSHGGFQIDDVLHDEVIRGQFLRKVQDATREFEMPKELDPARFGSEVRVHALRWLGFPVPVELMEESLTEPANQPPMTATETEPKLD